MRKLKLFLLTTFAILFAGTGYSQTNMIWHFGNKAKLDFNTTPPSPTTTSSMVTAEGSSGMTDLSGNDLFYTDGRKVWDKNGTQMPNGSGLKGDASTTSSAIVVPKPGSSTIFYIFTVHNSLEKTAGSFGYNYYEVDISLNGGLGDVVNNTGTLLYDNNTSNYPTEKITIAKHGNGTDYWVIIAPESNKNTIHAYQLSASGVNPTPVVSNVGSNQATMGYMKVNLTSDKLASTIVGGLEIYDFNSATGQVTNALKIGTFFFGYGVEFSPDGNTLYASQLISTASLYKFDLTATNISGSKVTMDTDNLYGAISIGPDQKIYVAHGNGGWDRYLGVINDPNNYSTPNYNTTGVNFGTGSVFRGLPTFVPAIVVPQCTPPDITGIDFSVTTNPICGEEFDMTVQFVKEAGVTYDIKWYKGQNASGTSVGSTETINITEVGTTYYTVQVSDVSDPSCAATFTTTEEIILENVPKFEFEVNHPDNLCLNSVATLSVKHSKPNFVKWDISGNTGLAKTGVGEEINGDTAFLYLSVTDNTPKSVNVFLESTEGCISTKDTIITFNVNNLPTNVSISGDNDVCEGESATYSVQGGATATSTYNWTYQHKNTTAIGPATGNTLTVDFTGVVATPTTISVIETDVNGCSTASASTLDVTVNQGPINTVFTGDNDACEGDTKTYTVTSPVGTSTYNWTYSHDGGTAITGTGTSFDVDFTGAVTSTVITLSQTNAAGCSSASTTNKTVTINARPGTASFTGDDNVCEGDNETYTVTSPVGTSTYNWTYTHNGGTTTNSIGNSLAVNYASVTTSPTVITLSETNAAGCTSAATSDLSVTVNGRPSTTAFTGNSDVCEGTSNTYTVTSAIGTSTYNWTYTHKNQGTVSENDQTALTIDFTGVTNTPTLITLSETNAAGCTSATTTDLSVNVSQSPSSLNISGVTKVCEGTSETFTVSGGTTAGSTYTWKYTHDGGTETTVVGNSLTIDFSGVTTSPTVITLSETNSVGCSSLTDATTSVVVNTRPGTAAFTGDNVVCEGDNKQYTVTGAVLGSTYNWTVTHNSQTATNATGEFLAVDYTGVNTSPTIIGLTETNAEGCTSAASFDLSVTVNGRPSTTAFTGPNDICEGVSGTYVATSPVGTSTYDWVYTHKNVTAVNIANTTSITIDYTGVTSTPTTITLVETNADGCTNSNVNDLLVNVSQSPATATISGVNEICEGSSSTFSIQGGVTAGSTYEWTYTHDGGSATTVSGDDLTVDFSGVTTSPTVITVTETNAIGCKTVVAATKSVIINGRPTTTAFTGTNQVCENDSETYTVTSPIGTSTYNWTYTHQGGSTVTKNNATSLLVDFTGITTTPTLITLSETNAKGCTSATTTDLSVIVNSLSGVITIDGNTAVCEGDEVTYSITGGANPASTYDWTYTHKNQTVVNVNNSDDLTIDFTNVLNTPTTITVQETNSSGCASNKVATLDVTVNSRPAAVTITGDNDVCEGDTENYQVDSPQGTSTYNWTYTHNGGTANNVANQDNIDINFTSISTTPTIITVSETDNNGCITKTDATYSVAVNGRPTTTAFTGDNEVCEGDTETYTVTTPAGTSTYAWTYTHQGGSTSNGTGTSIDVDFTGVSTTPTLITLSETNAKGCTSAATTDLSVTVNGRPTTTAFTGDNEVCEGESVTYTVTTPTGTSTYDWSYTHKNQIAVDVANQTNLTIDYTGVTNTPTLISLLETNAEGCTNSATIDLSVTVNQRPATGTIAGVDEICEGSSSTFTVQGGANSGSTYTWTYAHDGGSEVSSTGNDVTVDFTGVTTSSVITLSETNNSTGCVTETKATKTVTINGRPTTTAFTGKNQVCENEVATYTVTTPAGTSTYAWTYTHQGGSTSNGTGTSIDVDFTGITTTPTLITLSETNAKGCTSAATTDLSVIVNSLSGVITVDGDTEVCEGETVTYSITGGANPSSTYDWTYTHKNQTIVNVNNSDDLTIDFTNVLNTPTTITVQETNSSGCASNKVATLDVTVNSRPAAVTITGDNDVCEGDTENYTIDSPQGTSQYNWTYTHNGGSANNVANQDNINIDFTSVSTTPTIITVSETDNNGCITKTDATYSVAVNSRPASVTITGDNKVCEGDVENYQVDSPKGTSAYAWTYTHNGGSATNDNGTNINVDFTGITSTPTILAVIETDDNGCKTETAATFSVAVDSRPANIAITAVDSLCENGAATISVNNTTGSTYEWKVNNTIVADTDNSIDYTFTGFKNQFVFVEVIETNDNGCKTEAASKDSVYVQSLPSQPSIDGLTTFCLNDVGAFEAMGVNANSTFNWTYLGNPLTDKTKNVNITLDQVTAGGVITLTETTKELGCTSSTPASLTITVNSLPNTTDIALPDTICFEEEVTIAVVGGNASSTYTWNLGTVTSNITSATNQSSISFLLDGTSDNVTVIETDGNNCSSSAAITKFLTINPKPNTNAAAIVGDDSPQCNDANVVYNVNSPTATSSFAWSVTPAATLTESDNAATKDQVSIGLIDKQLTLSVVETSNQGCSNEIDSLVISPRGCGLVATIKANVTEFCANATGTFTDVSTHDAGIADVSVWYVLDNTNATIHTTTGDTETFTYTFTAAGSYKVVMEITENGVTKADTVDVVVNANPDLADLVIDLINGDDKVCETTENTLAVVDNGFQYSWSSNPNQQVIYESTKKDTITYKFGSDASVDITVTATDITTSTTTQCNTSAVKTINLLTQPNSDVIEGEGILCSGDTKGTFNVKDPQATSTYAWSWLNAAYTAEITTIGKGDNITVDFSKGQTNIVNPKLLVSQTNADGCTALTPDTLELQVVLTPTGLTGISITGTNHCDGDVKTLTAEGGNGSYGYLWSSNKWNPSIDPNGFVFFSTDSSNTIDATLTLQDPNDTIATFYVSQVNTSLKANCIGDSVQVNVTAHPNPSTVAFNNVNDVCAFTSDDIAVTATVGHTYDWYTGTKLLATNTETINYTFADTAVTFKVIETNQFGCTTENTKKVTIKGQPGSFSAAAANPLICSADSALFVISPISATSTYTWSFGGNVTGVTNHTTSGDSVYVKFNNTSTNASEIGTVTVLQTDLTSGCTTLADSAETFTFNITTTPLKLDSINFAGNFLCDTEDGTFTAFGGDAQYDYLWSAASTTSLINAGDKGNTVNATFTLPDPTKDLTSNIKVAQDNGGCIGDSTNLDFTIYANPALVGFNNLNEICRQTTDTLSVVRTDLKSTFDWFIGTTQIETNKDTIAYLFADTAVTFKVIETNEFGCTTESKKTITVKGQPGSFSATAADPLICSADSALFVISPISATSTYSWSFGGNVTGINNHTASGDSVYVQFNNTSTNDTEIGTVTVLQTDLTSGCTTLADSAETFDFTITTTPLKLDSINFAGNFLCDTEDGTFTAFGGKAQYDYLWSAASTTSLINAGDKGNTVNATFTLPDPTKDLTSNIKVAQDNGGCIGDSTNLDFTIYANPALVGFNNLNEICRQTTDTLSVVRTDLKSTFDWFIGTTQIETNKDTIAYLFADTAVTFKVIETNEFGCTTESEKTITVKGQPGSFSATAADPLICSADSALFVISPISATSTYSWSFGGNVTGINNYTASGDSVYVQFDNTSTNDAEIGTVTVLQTDLTSGCTTLADSAETFDFTITTTPLKLDSINFAGNFLCDTEDGTFTAFGGKAQYDYLWSTDFTTTTALVNAGDKGNTVNATFTLPDPTKDLTSNVKVAQDNGGCIGDSTNLDFTIYANPTLIGFNDDGEVCAFTTDTMSVTVTNPNSTFSWFLDGINLSNDDTLTYTFADDSLTFKVIETNEFGCATEQNKTVKIKGQPDQFFVSSADPLVCSADSALFIVSPINGNATYTWAFEGNVTGINNYTAAGDSVYIKFDTTSTNDSETGKLIVKQTDLTTGCTTLDGDAVTYDFDITTTPEILDSITFAGSEYICDGSDIEFTAHGGKTQYDYLWGTDFSTTTTLLDASLLTNIVNASFDLKGTLDTLTNIKVAQNNGGCIGDSLAVEFKINPNPNDADFIGQDSVCVQTKGTIKIIRSDTTTTLQWKVNGFTIPNFTGDSLKVLYTNEATYTILETDSLGCTTTHVQNVYLKEQPSTFNVIANKPLLCSEDTTIMYQVDPKDVNTSSTYTWTYKTSVVDELITDGNNSDSVFVKFNDPIVSQKELVLTVFETNQYGCTTLPDSVTLDTSNIYQTPKDITSITPPTILCDTEDGDFLANGGNAAYQYIWSTKTKATTTVDTTFFGNPTNVKFDLNNSTDTLGNIFVYQSNNGCLGDIDSLEFYIHTNPDTVIIAGVDDVCSFTKDTLFAIKVNPNATFDWTTTNYNVTSQDTITYQFADTSVTFTVTQKNQFGCTTDQSKTITIRDQPDKFTVTGQPLVCSADSALFVVNPIVTDSKYEWSFEGDAINNITQYTSSNDSVYVHFNTSSDKPIELGILKVKQINAQGCKTLDDSVYVHDFDVTTTPALVDSITFDPFICNQGSKQFTAHGGKANYEYLWSSDYSSTTNFVDASKKEFQVTTNFSLPINDTISNVKVSQNNDGCIGDELTLEVVVNILPIVPPIIGDTIVCARYDTLGLKVNVDPLWNVTWGVTDFTLIDSSYITRINVQNDSIMYLFNEVNEYTDTTVFFASVVDEKGCKSASPSYHTVYPDIAIQDLLAADVTITPLQSDEICDNLDLRHNWTFAFKPKVTQGLDLYNWELIPNDKKFHEYVSHEISTVVAEDSSIIKLEIDGEGSFILQVSPQNTNCKFSPKAFPIDIEVEPSKQVEMYIDTTITCLDDPNHFHAEVKITLDGAEFEGSTKENMLNQINYNWLYFDKDQDTLAISAIDIANELSIDTLANNDSIYYENGVQKGDVLDLSISPNFCAASDGLEQLKWSDTDTLTVVDYPKGGINITSVTPEKFVKDSLGMFVIDDVISLELTNTAVGENDTTNYSFTYNWSYYNPDTDTLENDLIKNYDQIIASYPRPLELQLTDIVLEVAYSEGYCKSKFTAQLWNNFTTFIPNAFSPNEDGIFDTWIVRNIDKHPEATVEIYNRWGALVFEGPATIEGWYGQTTDGEDLPMGTYFYILKKSPDSEGIAGSVTIMK